METFAMNLKLTRTHFLEYGIFGILTDSNDNKVCVTLERAYPTEYSGEFRPKMKNGVYVCKRGMHRLRSMSKPFETFEITKVPGHTGILFHVGNTNNDSEGCVLVGADLVHIGKYPRSISSSKVAFLRLMALQEKCNSFTIVVG